MITVPETSPTLSEAALVLLASATPAIREAWDVWQRHANAWHDALGRSDTDTATTEQSRADEAVRQLVTIPSTRMDDVAVKSYVAVWVGCHGGSDALLDMIDETVEAETMALQPPIHIG